MASNDDNHSAYDYSPSQAAAILFLAIYSLPLVGHICQAVRFRTFWAWPLICGLVLEVLGFATRYISARNVTLTWPAVVTQVAVIVAPAWLAAYVYMSVGRIMSFLGAEYSPVSHNALTKIFVIADFISIFSQGGAGGLLSSDDLKTLHVGFNILIAALTFQVVMFIIFIGLTVVFDIRSRRGLRERRQPIQPLIYATYTVSAMIILRSIYRLIEFATVKFTPDGAFGYTLEHEWLLYVFDALPITLASVILAVIYAGQYLPRTKGLRIDGTHEDLSTRVCGCLWRTKSARRAKSQSFGLQEHRGNMSSEAPTSRESPA
ncbi:RTA1 like protein-domain-containing protein [Auriculariales sp. MPI-PUGE-AT-0066]|nr:RTA1 like protein-domain-containing protein [Auriculariales sp. MPI-PUGE-AT-0066]